MGVQIVCLSCTTASYLRLLSQAFLVLPLERFSGSKVRQRGSTPKIVVLDNGLVTSMLGLNFKEAKKNSAFWGRLTENAVGARLFWRAQETGQELFYWRDRDGGKPPAECRRLFGKHDRPGRFFFTGWKHENLMYSLRLSQIHPILRHHASCLSAHVWRQGVHAASGWMLSNSLKRRKFPC